MRFRETQVGVQVLSALFVAVASWGSAQADNAVHVSSDAVWYLADDAVAAMESDQSVEKWVEPSVFRAVQVDDAALRETLEEAPLEFTPEAASAPGIISLPMPDGTFARFRFVESPVMAPELAAKFPEIKTYLGQGIDDPTATVRFDRTPSGFHAQILSRNGTVMIDPYFKDNSALHVSYFKHDHPRSGFQCFTEAEPAAVEERGFEGDDYIRSVGETLRVYSLACAANGEYTSYHGGTVTAGLAAVTTAVNRVTGIYELDVSVRMVLVANNNLIIYTNAGTDPYDNTSPGNMLGQNQTTCDTVIGSANYDIGHVVSTGGGGIAQLNAVCGGGVKARGVTGTNVPVGDPFTVDYMAHEMGHQFGAAHSFNGTGSACSGNRSASSAYEPGSGSTIMSYAGICGADDLQSNSDAYFHSVSQTSIINLTSGHTCDTEIATGNLAPTVNAGIDYTIPASTPFKLTATGSDANGDVVSYCWEQRDLGPAASLATPDQGSIPLFRSWDPTPDPSRSIPRLKELLANSVLALGERNYATTNRTLHFRCTARDQRGGTAFDDMQAVVSAAAGPFAVTAPNTAVTWNSSPQTVNWNVANTSIAPVNTANVNIRLSLDGGVSWPMLLANTPNDGSESVTVPALATSTARIMVEGAGNIFFDIGNVNFTIAMPVQFARFGPDTIDDSAPNGNNTGSLDPGESSVDVYIGVQNTGSSNATGISATLTSLTPTVTVLSGASTYADMSGGGGNGDNVTPFVLSVDPGHLCGAPVALSLNVISDQGGRTLDVTLPTGEGVPVIFDYDAISGGDAVVSIPDARDPVDVAVSVSGVGTIADVDFKFDGTVCNTAVGSTTVGLSHPQIGHIHARLISPAGTQVPLVARIGGGGTGSTGNHFCQTRFDDDGAYPSIQSVTAAGEPYTGTWRPYFPLSDFDGENADGTWILRVRDTVNGQAGTVRAFSIIITPRDCVGPEMPGDVDGDGDVDARDHQSFVDCMNGPDVSTPPAGCPQENFDRADAIGDNDVDLEDWSVLEELLP